MTLSAKIEDVYQNDGSAISKTIAVITLTSKMIFVPIKAIENVPSQSSDVTMQNVYQLDGSATMMTIVATDRMKENAQTILAQLKDSNVTVDIVSKKN